MGSLIATCLKFLGFFLSLFPRPVVRFMGSLIGVLWFDILRFRRQMIIDNIAIAFPEMPLDERIRIGRSSMYRLGAHSLEFFTLPYLDQKWLKKHVVFHGLEHLEKARLKDKGVLVLGMHMGSGDLTASTVVMAGYPMHIISKFFGIKWLNDIWFGIRGSQGVKFIEPHGEKTAFEILRAVKAKSDVAFVIDQFMGRPFAVENFFFGRKTGTAKGLALFVLKTGSPVVPLYAYEEAGKAHIVFQEELDLQRFIAQDKEQAVVEMTQHFNHVLESIIRKHPMDWMWIHRRWKEYE